VKRLTEPEPACAIPTERIENGQGAVSFFHERRLGRMADLIGIRNDLPMGRLGFFVDPPDRGTWQDVVELIDEDFFPNRVEAGEWIRMAGGHGGDGAPQFSIVHRELALAIAELGAGLGGVRAAVLLEIHFADVPIRRRDTLQIVEKFQRSRQLHFRHAFQVLVAANEL